MRYNTGMSFRITRERFEKLAEEAVTTLPEEFKEYFTNITVVVEDYPSREDARSTGARRDELLGLFRGVAYTERGGLLDIPPPLPDVITLFKHNLEQICESEEDLVEEIQKTVMHEVGHYFGLSEEDLEEYE
ncbi:MAG: metallopeptidase family protein [Chloroflexota bacterium]